MDISLFFVNPIFSFSVDDAFQRSKLDFLAKSAQLEGIWTVGKMVGRGGMASVVGLRCLDEEMAGLVEKSFGKRGLVVKRPIGEVMRARRTEY